MGNASEVTVIFHIQSRMDLKEGRTGILLQLCVKHQVKAGVGRITHQSRHLLKQKRKIIFENKCTHTYKLEFLSMCVFTNFYFFLNTFNFKNKNFPQNYTWIKIQHCVNSCVHLKKSQQKSGFYFGFFFWIFLDIFPIFTT